MYWLSCKDMNRSQFIECNRHRSRKRRPLFRPISSQRISLAILTPYQAGGGGEGVIGARFARSIALETQPNRSIENQTINNGLRRNRYEFYRAIPLRFTAALASIVSVQQAQVYAVPELSRQFALLADRPSTALLRH